jgi:hypothetical protein
MSIAGPAILPIFATPLGVVSLGGPPNLNAELAALLRSRATEERRDPALPRDPRCFRSREDLFEWPEEAARALRLEMLGGICTVVKALNLYADAEFQALSLQARARFAIVRPDGSIPAATASMAAWHAVYCIAAPPPAPTRADSGALRLYGLRHGTMFLDASNWRLRPPFETSHQIWRPEPGQMLVFPASILYEVALNRTDAELLLVSTRVRFIHGGQTAIPPW